MALKSTDIRDIKDKGDHYHLTFKMYDSETLLPTSDIAYFANSRMYENIHYQYVRRYYGQDGPDFGFIDGCSFYKEVGLPYDYCQFHLLVPKTVTKVVDAVNNGDSIEVYMENMGGMVRLVILIVESVLKRNEKLKKIKNNICPI